MAQATDPSNHTIQLRPTAHRVVHSGRLVLAHRGRQVRLDPYGTLEQQLVQMLADSLAVDRVNEWLSSRFDPEGVGRAKAIVDELLNADIVRILPPQPSVPERFERTLIYLSQFAAEPGGEHDLLARLRASIVVIVGVGGLGSWIAAGLAGLGVGRLRVIDCDVVEASNLNRTILLHERDVGRSKLEAFKDRLRATTAHTETETFTSDVARDGLPAPVLDGAALVLSTADKPAWVIRRNVADACVPKGIPFLCPAGFRVGPFYLGPGTACVMCEYSELVAERPGMEAVMQAQGDVPPAQPGSAPHIAASVASIVLQDALRMLTGIADPATQNRVWTADPELASHYVPQSPYPRCVSCQGAPRSEACDDMIGSSHDGN